MNRILFATAMTAGALAIVWTATTFAASDYLALAVILAIGCVYAIGCLELLTYRRATTNLSQALTGLPPLAIADDNALTEWLGGLPSSVRNPVRLRIEGERAGLPAPAITPYLVGLLVMLGLLGTFIGMVETLRGTVAALEGTTELQAIRAGLAAPINGLSLAFGTSVAGVAASAMLGLIATLSRRDRMLTTRQLDTCCATILQPFSLTYQRRQAYQALAVQARAVPETLAAVHALTQQLDQGGRALADHLLQQQAQFQQAASTTYTELARSVEQSLHDTLAASGRLLAQSITPPLTETLNTISTQLDTTHRQLLDTVQQQLATQQQQTRDRLNNLTASTTTQLAELGKTLAEPMTELVAAANQAPQAAAELISQLRTEISGHIERDNALLRERAETIQELSGLASAFRQACDSQRDTTVQLVAAASQELQGSGARFAEQVDGKLGQISDTAGQFASSAVELASLGEAFGAAVELFNASNSQLMDSLERIENAMVQASARSDEQMGYYVAQAREIIDQSLLSHQNVFAQLQQRPVTAPATGRQHCRRSARMANLWRPHGRIGGYFCPATGVDTGYTAGAGTIAAE